MSFIRDQCAIMGQLQIDLARQFEKMTSPTREELEEREHDPEYRAARAEYYKDCKDDR